MLRGGKGGEGNFHRVKHPHYYRICRFIRKRSVGSRTASGRVLITLRSFDCGTFNGSFCHPFFLERHYSIRRMHLVRVRARKENARSSPLGVTFISKRKKKKSVLGYSKKI